MGGVGGEAEELIGKSRGYVDSMTCTSYASVSGMSEYWTRMIDRMTETEGVRRPFGSLVNVEKGKPRRGVRIASELHVKHCHLDIHEICNEIKRTTSK